VAVVGGTFVAVSRWGLGLRTHSQQDYVSFSRVATAFIVVGCSTEGENLPPCSLFCKLERNSWQGCHKIHTDKIVSPYRIIRLCLRTPCSRKISQRFCEVHCRRFGAIAPSFACPFPPQRGGGNPW